MIYPDKGVWFSAKKKWAIKPWELSPSDKYINHLNEHLEVRLIKCNKDSLVFRKVLDWVN